ncbi:MAG: IspD/TarI family cytidylyltransferase [Casimicrobiaceae bacterium]
MGADRKPRARTWIIVAAAGGGTRFGATLPKQYADLGGKPVLARTLDRLSMLRPEATVVAIANGDSCYDAMIGTRPGVVALRCGGATRGATVRNALQTLAPRCDADDWILVHDAARPCVPREALSRLCDELADDRVGGLLALPLAETLKRAEQTATCAKQIGVRIGQTRTHAEQAGAALRVLRTETRDGWWLAQTPQMFRYRLLVAAYDQEGAFDCTDDAEAVEQLAAAGGGAMPRLVRGSPDNVKITRPDDLALALAILKLQEDA